MINEKDNVATALEALKPGAVISVEHGGYIENIRLVSEIPPGHKFSLIDIDEGAAIIKYGEPIGQSTVKIVRGEHVHIHNMVSQPKNRAQQ